MIRVKICGITNEEDALYASSLGASALGFVFYEGSKRYISVKRAEEIIEKLPPFLIKVGVFVNEEPEKILTIMEHLSLDRVQIHSDFKEEVYQNLPRKKVIWAHRVKSREDVLKALNSPFFPLFDRYDEKDYGGTGKSFDWSFLKGINVPFILAGGINEGNIDRVIALRPYAIDISSGVEKDYGIKDHKKMFEIFKRLRENQVL